MRYLILILFLTGCVSKTPVYWSPPKNSANGYFIYIDLPSSNIHVRANFVYVENSKDMLITNSFVWVQDNQIRQIPPIVHYTLWMNNPDIAEESKLAYTELYKVETNVTTEATE